jgi:hypothetical protein
MSGSQGGTCCRTGAGGDELHHHLRAQVPQPLSPLDQCGGALSPRLEEDLSRASVDGPTVDVRDVCQALGRALQDRGIGRNAGEQASRQQRFRRVAVRGVQVQLHWIWCSCGYENQMPPSTTMD